LTNKEERKDNKGRVLLLRFVCSKKSYFMNYSESERGLEVLVPGEKGVIKRFSRASPAYRQALISMGLLPGTEFTFMRRAPFGDPVQLKVRGTSIVLRKEEARLLVIDKV
jgi:ferrous iron transport protein A